MEKIAVIGPVYPYKGGIAHYTSILYKTLSKKYDTTMISFKRQYPTFLYPGKEQKDFENDKFKIDGTRYLIDTINPFNWVKVFLILKKLNTQLVIFQWWNPFFAFSFSAIAFLLKHFSKTQILFLCHNVIPHEKIPFSKLLTKTVLGCGNLFIVHSSEDEENLKKLKPDCHYKKTYLPTFSVFKNHDTTRNEACQLLGINPENRILLFFGFIREYKGLIYLIDALAIVKKHIPDITLLIVGDFYDDKTKYISRINKLGLINDIVIFDGYIPDNEVERFFTACDIVVLPYISATQSAIVQIAYGFDKPVVVTNVGGLPEVVDNGKTGYVVKSMESSSIAEALVDFYEKDRKQDFISNIQKIQYKFSWGKMLDTIEELFSEE